MARIDFSVHFYGDDAARRASVAADLIEVKPLAESSAAGDPVALRVRATGVPEGDLARLTGTRWTDAAVEDPRSGRTIEGQVSNLEAQDGGELEFLLTPTA